MGETSVRGRLCGAAWVALVVLACADPAPRAAISQAELLERMASEAPPLVLDVRTPREYAGGHVPGAVNIAHTELEARLAELGAAEGRHVVVYCESGRRAALAETLLREAGFTGVLHLEGDMRAWRAAALPCEGC